MTRPQNSRVLTVISTMPQAPMPLPQYIIVVSFAGYRRSVVCWSWSSVVRSVPPWPSCPPCIPCVMKIIMSGQVSTSAATSSVWAGTPSATRPTTPIARAMVYRPHGWRFIMSPFPRGISLTVLAGTGVGYGRTSRRTGSNVPTRWGYTEGGWWQAPGRENVMGVADIAVLLASAVVLAGLGWFFFGPRRPRTAELGDGVQRVEVTVRGGYRPDVVRVRQGVPLEVVFDRQETGDCTSRVVFADLGVSAALPAYQRTTVRMLPARAGEFGFACGMNMIHGRLVVEPVADAAPVDGAPPAVGAAAAEGRPVAGEAGPAAAEVEAAQAAERCAEIADL